MYECLRLRGFAGLRTFEHTREFAHGATVNRLFFGFHVVRLSFDLASSVHAGQYVQTVRHIVKCAQPFRFQRLIVWHSRIGTPYRSIRLRQRSLKTVIDA